LASGKTKFLVLFNSDTRQSERKELIARMDNFGTEKLDLHEGHDDDFDEDNGELMDEEHPM